MKIDARYLAAPMSTSDSHVRVEVSIRNDGPTAVTGQIEPVSPLGRSPHGYAYDIGPTTVNPGETTVVSTMVHMSTGPVNAPEVPTFTFEPVV